MGTESNEVDEPDAFVGDLPPTEGPGEPDPHGSGEWEPLPIQSGDDGDL